MLQLSTSTYSSSCFLTAQQWLLSALWQSCKWNVAFRWNVSVLKAMHKYTDAKLSNLTPVQNCGSTAKWRILIPLAKVSPFVAREDTFGRAWLEKYVQEYADYSFFILPQIYRFNYVPQCDWTHHRSHKPDDSEAVLLIQVHKYKT